MKKTYKILSTALLGGTFLMSNAFATDSKTTDSNNDPDTGVIVIEEDVVTGSIEPETTTDSTSTTDSGAMPTQDGSSM
jgi:hypothetical protein